MSEMIERVARALAQQVDEAAYNPIENLSGVGLDGVVDLLALARAAIEAMREPTEEMIEAGAAAGGWDERFEPIEAAIERSYEAMVGCALKLPASEAG